MNVLGSHWILATSNPGKLREFQALLSPFAIKLNKQGDFQVTDAEETGLSFVENAIIKARHASRATGLPALADDSGLEVDALNGAPGIYSARYAGTHGNDVDNLNRVLTELTDVPDAERSARFQCLLVFMRHAEDPTPLIFQGTWEGFIERAPRGDNGFGYDPIFRPNGRDITSAELDSEVKNRLSHRGQALLALVNYLQR